MPLWQFVVLAVGCAIAGDVDIKFMYALIGQRDSGKGMLMTALSAAFGDLIDTGKSANNLLGNDSSADEAKKYMWLADAAVSGVRLLWTNEVRTVSTRGETFIDGNLVKGIASGGDALDIRANFENPYPARHEITMFVNCNDLPPVRPAIGDSFLRIRFPNKYVESPCAPNHKRKDDGLKRRLVDPSFRDGMLWLVLDTYKSFIDAKKAFRPIPEVLFETQEANHEENEDIVDALSELFEFAPPFSSVEECHRGGFLVKPKAIKDALSELKKRDKLRGVSQSGVFTQLGFRGYRKTPTKIRFDCGAGDGVQLTFWVTGMKARQAEDSTFIAEP